ncbi:endo-beta-glucanase [Neofusicoccum parvum]|uniref:Endo-beta-glucanase n=1 Tax=Neofusicoccum parvum TaxID=310453 RepID=A0ACB5RXZ3_9PEZI|nr:endo-beta-glucanase [Neofusicoccum parvum]
MPRGPSWAISLLSTLLFSKAAAQTYTLVDDYSAQNWFDKFNFFTDGDPTNGFVQYVNETVAASNGLIGTNSNRIYMGVDHTNTYKVGGPGRPSVRLQSKKLYNHGLFILDLNHMPVGCGAWPAWWTLGESEEWPRGGEIDIIEGVNTNLNNTNKIYTSSGCSITGMGQTAIADSFDCANGCGSASTRTDSYGAGFNNGKGGVYAMEWTSQWIRIWFFPRSNIPSSIGTGSPDISEFGMPTANFQGGCDIDQHFKDHTIIFDITFCGDWAGNTFGKYPGCPMTSNNAWESCNNFVAGSPKSFTDAYWDINSMRVFQQGKGGSQSPAAPSKVSLSDAVRLSSSVGVPLGKGGSATPGSVTPVIPTTAGINQFSLPIAGGDADPSTPASPSSSLAAGFFAENAHASIATRSSPYHNGYSAPMIPGFATSSPQPCSPIAGYGGPVIGYRHGIGDAIGGLAMCQGNCADYPSCSNVLYVHYEGDYGSPLGYWDCWWGVLSAAQVECGGSAVGGDGPGGLADAETQANVGVLSSGEVPGGSGASSAGKITANNGKKRAAKHRLLAKRQALIQAINMAPSRNAGFRVEDYQVLMQRSGNLVSSSPYGSLSRSASTPLRSSSQSTPASSRSTPLSSDASSLNPYGVPSGTSTSPTQAAPTDAPDQSPQSSPDVVEGPSIAPSILPFSVASIGFRSTSTSTSSSATSSPSEAEVYKPTAVYTPDEELPTSTSDASSESSAYPLLVPDLMPAAGSSVITPYIPDEVPTQTASSESESEPSSSDAYNPTTNTLRSDPRPALTASDDSYYTSISSSLSAEISSSLSAELYSSLSSSLASSSSSSSSTIPLSAYSAASLDYSSSEYYSSAADSGYSSSTDEYSVSTDSSSSTSTDGGYTLSTDSLYAPSSSDTGYTTSSDGSPATPLPDIYSPTLTTSGPSVSTDDEYTATLYWGPDASSASSSACHVMATVTVTVTKTLEAGGRAAASTPVQVGTPGVF